MEPFIEVTHTRQEAGGRAEDSKIEAIYPAKQESAVRCQLGHNTKIDKIPVQFTHTVVRGQRW